MFKVNQKNLPKRRQWYGSGVFIINFDILTFSSVSIVNFKQVNVSWVVHQLFTNINYIVPQQSPDMARADKNVGSQWI